MYSINKLETHGIVILNVFRIYCVKFQIDRTESAHICFWNEGTDEDKTNPENRVPHNSTSFYLPKENWIYPEANAIYFEQLPFTLK